ncbi:MAG: hypothetical protein BWY83_01976 [bacterium ADurb.Bin478]|nr:MAG: hypothetical protein BWY83_01976 [bacterium ADurb.Bin478]
MRFKRRLDAGKFRADKLFAIAIKNPDEHRAKSVETAFSGLCGYAGSEPFL